MAIEYGGSNPYIQQQAKSIEAMANQNLAQQVMPGIRSGALASGQYGGSRQGIAEGVAAGNSQTGIASAQANLFGNAYAQDEQNKTARYSADAQTASAAANAASNRYSADLQYNLGMTNASNNFYTNQRGQDLTQYQLGSSLFGGGVNGQAGLGAGQYETGNTAYQAPLNTLQQYTNTLTPWSNLGSTQISGGGPGAVASGVGGALAGAQIGRNLGMGSSPSAYSPGGAASSGFGSGAAFGNQDLGQYF